MKNLWILGLLFLAALSACETENAEDVPQNRIYTRYELLYIADEDVTKIRTTFRFGNNVGTSLELSENASITFNNETLPFSTVLGFYELEKAGLVSQGTFSYTDEDGTEFTNTIQLEAISFTENVPDVLEKGTATEISWNGGPVGAGSAVVVTLVPNNIAQTRIFTQINTGANSLVIPSGGLDEVDPQPGRLVIERRNSLELQEATEAGGVLEANYRGSSLDVTVE